MKRLVITLFALAVLGLIAPGLPTLAQPTQVPHENPDTATGSLDSITLLLSYSKIINLATSRQYQSAQSLLQEMEHADIPDELRYIIDRYSNLCQQIFTNLDNLESILDEASTLLAHNQIHEAKQKLDNAEANIQDTRSLLADIEAATDTLSDKLGISASPEESRIRQAHVLLEESLERLEQITEELNNLRQSQTDLYVQKIRLIPTELSLSINPASAFVGDSITASGKLSSNGKPLTGRKITLALGNKTITTVTKIDGSYVTYITIPYKYVPTMTLTAVYEPSGDDTDIYLASWGPPATVNVGFYHTLLEVSAPEIMHPGLPSTISGRVSTTDSNPDRTVKVLLDDTRLTEATVAGEFSLEATPPALAATDNHTLTVAVTPQGHYAGATDTRSISVSILPIHIDAQTPSLVVLPGALSISGRVYHKLGPVPNARVNLDFKNSTGTTRTSHDGSFATALKTPLDLSLSSPQELTITVEPVEPWYSALSVKRQPFTINPLTTGLMLVILVALGFLIYRMSKTRLGEEKDSTWTEVTTPAITPAPEPRPRFTGIKGRILSAYRHALEAAERVSGVGMAPNITMREFLKKASQLPPTATGLFTELTTIAEITLYSARSPRGDTATKAENLANNIREELRRGTS